MGLWNGSSINTNALASMFNEVDRSKFFDIVRRKNALLFMVLGKPDFREEVKTGTPKFNKLESIAGYQKEVRQLGSYPQPAYLTDGTAELTRIDWTTGTYYNNAAFGASVFDLAHFWAAVASPGSEVSRIKGDFAKTKSWVSDMYYRLMYGFYQNTMGPALGGVNAPARNQVGGWPYAISDGVSAGETGNASYGSINRADSGNAIFRSVVDPTTTSLNLADIQNLQNNVVVQGGSNLFGVVGTALYGKLQGQIQGYTHMIMKDSFAEWGAQYIEFSGIPFLLDQYTPSGTLGLLDPESWNFYDHDTTVTPPMTFYNDPTVPDGYILKGVRWFQAICTMTQRNGKLTNRS